MLLIQSQLLSLLNRVLNQTALLRKGGVQAVYQCSFCHHYKKKLEINLSTQEYHCWVCNTAGKSIRSLFKRLQVEQSYYQELYKILPPDKSYRKPQNETESVEEFHTLPQEFIPLSISTKSSFEYGNALYYLKSRGITKCDIVRYNIGYCERGAYQRRIIIPSYDKNGKLNFFTSRIYYETEGISKYKNPPWNRDIIGFELFINWKLPITLVESVFNAITIKRNAIPLFGKILSPTLKERLIENGVSRVNVCLDKDAKKDSLLICEKLLSMEIDPYFVELTKKDPNEIGFEKMNELISNAKMVDFSFIINKKLNF